MKLQSLDIAHRSVEYAPSVVIFSQGDAANEVMYLQHGAVKLTVVSPAGKEAIISVLQPGDFFGEGCLAGQPQRMATAVAVNPSTVAVIDKSHMLEMMHRLTATRSIAVDRWSAAHTQRSR